jgi:hypothetical protein
VSEFRHPSLVTPKSPCKSSPFSFCLHLANLHLKNLPRMPDLEFSELANWDGKFSGSQRHTMRQSHPTPDKGTSSSFSPADRAEFGAPAASLAQSAGGASTSGSAPGLATPLPASSSENVQSSSSKFLFAVRITFSESASTFADGAPAPFFYSHGDYQVTRSTHFWQTFTNLIID